MFQKGDPVENRNECSRRFHISREVNCRNNANYSDVRGSSDRKRGDGFILHSLDEGAVLILFEGNP